MTGDLHVPVSLGLPKPLSCRFMGASLAGVRSKIDRANKHFDEVNAAVEIALGAEDKANLTPPYEYEPVRQQLIVACPKPRPVDPALPLAIGDCIHNLRSALDHLIFQLAVLNSKAVEAEKTISFPVFLTDKDFQGFIKKKVAPFIDRKALAEIEKLQPYQSGNAHEADILWVLSQLDIIDKHRLLVVIARYLTPTGFTIVTPTGDVFDESLPRTDWKPMEDGTEILRFDLSGAIKTPGKVQVKLQLAAMVSLKDTGLSICDGREIRSILSTCTKAVTNIAEDFGIMFFGEGLPFARRSKNVGLV
jgi:hypothetical protein